MQQLSVKVQTQRQMGLLKQLGTMKFLLRQGLSLRGHIEHEGNLPQLLSTWSAISLYRGQAAIMKGIRSGVAVRIRNEVPQALPVHACLAQCLNLCLQDAGKQINLLRNAIQLVKKIAQLINCAPKRKHLFSQYLLAKSDRPSDGLQPL